MVKEMRIIDTDLLMENLGFMDTEEEREGNIGQIITWEDVDRLPTVFDVEKVIEELEDLREAELSRPDMCGELGDGDGEAQYNDGVSQGRYEAFIEAIEIVKRGGRDEE